MNNFFAHARFKAPLATARSAISGIWRTAYAAAGLYEPLPAAERQHVKGEAVSFLGDLPVNVSVGHFQERLLFAKPRPLIEEVDDLVFTPGGAGWAAGRLYERYSACVPGLRMLAAPAKPARELAEAYVVQAEHSDTFGDWFSEYLTPLAQLDNIGAPVLLPNGMAARSYVKRDMRRLDIRFEPVETPVLVRKAYVVRQQRVIRYWGEGEAVRLRRLLHAHPPPPRPGSLLYLSRYGEKSEVANRTYPSEAIEKIVKARGGRILRTAQASLEDYLSAAHDAETILYDHGSAAYNMIYWNPRRAVEFVSDDWWVNAFLFFADAIGVRDYSIICTDQGGVGEVMRRLEATLDRPLALDAAPAT